MTVKELIKQLKELNEDANIIIDNENDNLQLHIGQNNSIPDYPEYVSLKFIKKEPINDGDIIAKIMKEFYQSENSEILKENKTIISNILNKYRNVPIKLLIKTNNGIIISYICSINHFYIFEDKVDIFIEIIGGKRFIRPFTLSMDSKEYDFSFLKLLPLNDEDFKQYIE